MSERLENFIRNNSRQFDEYGAPNGLWEKIEKELDATEKRGSEKRDRVVKLSFVLKIAASVVVVLSVGLFYWLNQKNGANTISNIDPQLAKQEFHYASVIQEKRNELKQIKKTDPDLYKEFSSELKAIDENYKKLKNDLSTSPNQEKTVKAMIRNLQIQIQVLNQQLQIIEQINEFKQTDHEI